jgi:hypothetical protein
MREALGDVTPNDGYTSGWVWSYPLKAALEAAAEAGDLTREGVARAASELESVDYEGMLPEEAGRFAGETNETVFRQVVVAQPDDDAATGVRVIEGLFAGDVAENYDMTAPCFGG